jgi:glycosyltransferase involved in cell wall biosynthesis
MTTILIITDAFLPQVNGVVTTFINTIKVLEQEGFVVDVISPSLFKTIPLIGYREIRIAINPWIVGKLIETINPDHIHIATEGPIGLFAGIYCRKKGYQFSTSYHTKMPEYIKERYKVIPVNFSYTYMKFIHRGSSNILVTTDSMKTELLKQGFKNKITVWGRGVDTTIFNDTGRIPHKKLSLLYVGRISIEKNIKAYLDMPVDAVKYVVGNGPLLETYKKNYKNDPNIIFVGEKKGKELQYYYVNADVFVFPSKTDTLGIVLLESIACGTPVIAYPVTGPIDCITDGLTGILSNNLGNIEMQKAILLDRHKIFEIGQTLTWEKCTDIFRNSLVRALNYRK